MKLAVEDEEHYPVYVLYEFYSDEINPPIIDLSNEQYDQYTKAKKEWEKWQDIIFEKLEEKKAKENL